MAQGSNGRHTQKTCMQCDVPQLARNHYFTGKLLVERDFTDEQLYQMGKEKRHARHLHGSGSVCGLKVKQHSDPACRDQYVVIEPGTAIDCCGRELLVTREEYFDFQEKIKDKKKDLGAGEHTLQICIRYNECPTEQVPVLFDDCSCDGTASQPNRILEGYDFDVLIEPVIKHRILDDVHLEWQHTLNIVNANRIAVDEANHRLYVLTADTPSTLYAYRTDNYSVVASQVFNVAALDVALSRDGTRAYVSVKQKNSVLVLDTAALGTPHAVINELPAPGAPTEDVRLAVSPRDGHLYVLDVARRIVTPWRAGINYKSDDVDDYKLHDIRVGNAPHSITASPDGKWIFVANSGDKTVSAIDAVSHGQPPTLLRLGNLAPSELAVADTPDGLKLYVADSTNNTVSILGLQLRADPPFTMLGSPLSFAPDKPVGVAASPTGRWLYVLLADANGKGRIQVVDAHRVEVGAAYPLGDSLPVGSLPSEFALISARQRLYVAFQGKSADTDPGGVATIRVLEETCEDLFKRALDNCPDCEDDDECVVLATIKGYKANGQITQEVIDNLSDRHLLPSTDLVTDVVRCILANGGGKGQRGEEGPPGKNGRGIEEVQATIVECDQPGSAKIEEIDEKRTLVLEIPRGCDAPTPPPVELTSICGINWQHRGTMVRENLEDGLLIAFTRRIRAGDINMHTFQVLVRTEEEGLICWCELPARHVRGVQLELAEGENGTCEIREIEQAHPDHNAYVNGALFRPEEYPPGPWRVVLKGDLIQDEQGRGVDANHLPPWLPNRLTGDGVEGGTFESWFTIEATEPEEQPYEPREQAYEPTERSRGSRERPRGSRERPRGSRERLVGLGNSLTNPESRHIRHGVVYAKWRVIMRLNTDTMKAHDASCVCPACLGLECLERPRYFSGQLLTEAELNSEQAYILAKNRLHNRYLHGSGIVCGLQISCSDCEGVVTIQSGYAIDPCGNDIIVCDTQDFDVIKRIRECDDQRKRRRKSDCDPVRPPADKNCKDIERHYCLTVAYQEIEARPINALRKTSTTSSTRNGKGNGCGCNSSQSGNGMMSSGSGTSYATSSSTTMQTVQSNMPIGCEPTRIFEGYRFDVVEVPPDYCENLKVSLENTLLGKIIACLTTLRAFLDKRLPSSTYTTLAPLAFLANTEASPQELYESCCRLRQAVYDLYLQDPLNTHCTALDILTQVVCQPPSVDEKTKKLSADVRESYIQQVRATLYQLLALLLQYTLDCICNALMPPCPLAPAEDRLILACLTVKDDKLVEICDFCQRRYAGSFPSLYYWLSLVPIVPLIAYAVERICCYDWLKLDFTNAQGDQQGTYGGNLMNRLTLLLDRIDPSGSLRKAIFAENFAWPRSYASRFEQIIQNISPSKITDVLHPENFNMSTIVGKPVKEATAAMNKAGVTPIVREVASVNEMPLLSNLAAPPFARSGDQVVVYKLGDNVVGYAAYTPSPSEVSEIKNDVARLSDELSKAAQPAAVQPQPEVTAMQETINTLQVDLAALKNEVEKLKAGGAQPPSEPPKA